MLLHALDIQHIHAQLLLGSASVGYSSIDLGEQTRASGVPGCDTHTPCTENMTKIRPGIPESVACPSFEYSCSTLTR